MLRFLILALVFAMAVYASVVQSRPQVVLPGDRVAGFPLVAAAEESSSTPPPVKSLIQSPSMNSREAAARAKAQCPDCKILSVTPAHNKGADVYQVKTLKDGVVRYIYVGADG